MTQVPWFSGCISDKVTHTAWHDKPSWCTTASTSHVAMLADPEAVMKEQT